MYNYIYACLCKVINELDGHRKKDIDEMKRDEMRWLLVDDEDDVWIVCDFRIQYFILIWRFLMKLNDVSHLCLNENHMIVLIVTCYLIFIFELSLDIDICIRISGRRFVNVKFDMISYDMICCLCISMYNERHCYQLTYPLIQLLIQLSSSLLSLSS